MKLSTQNTLSITNCVHEGSRLKFFPFLIRRINKNDYNVIRLGCSSITAVGTREMGVEAMKLLRKGASLGQTKAILASRYQSSAQQIDLTLLINALMNAKLIRSIDGRILAAEKPNRLRSAYHCLQCGVLALREVATTAAVKYLPVGLAHRILFCLQLTQRRKQRESVQSRVKTSLRLAFKTTVTENWIQAVATEYKHEGIRRNIDVECLMKMPAHRISSWLESAFEISGREYLDAARAEGRGVILCGFHFSSPLLLSILLWLRNYSLAVIGLMGRIGDQEKLRSYYEGVKKQTPCCGNIKWFVTLDLKSLSEIRKALANKEMTLLFGDAFVSELYRPNKDQALYLGHSVAEYLPARTKVRFLGQTIVANKGAAWLHLQTGAPIVPIKLVRKTCTTYQVVLKPQINFDGQTSIDAVTAAVYQALEEDIHLCPGQWGYWNAFHQMLVPSTQEMR